MAPSQAVRESVELAIVADRLGYTRYWFAVEVFRTLEALHPGRIDLGLGRAPGTDPVTAAALRRSDDPEVNHLLAELLAFEEGAFPERHPFSKIVPMPSDVGCSTIWMLGSTLAGATIAAQLGVPYAFAGHFAMSQAREAIAHYRARFEPSRRLAAPYAMCAVTVICGADAEDARRLAAPVRVAVVNSRTGKRAPIPSVEDALAHPLSPDEQAIAADCLAGAVIGGPDHVRDRLPALAREIGADELMLSTLVPSFEARRQSLERIAAAALL